MTSRVEDSSALDVEVPVPHALEELNIHNSSKTTNASVGVRHTETLSSNGMFSCDEDRGTTAMVTGALRPAPGMTYCRAGASAWGELTHAVSGKR